MPTLRLNYVALTDVGLRRSNNQDSGYASNHLLALADGMGGAAGGDVASSTTLNIIRRLDRDLDDEDAQEALIDVVAAANVRLGELVRDYPAVEGMGTTLDAFVWDGTKFATAHIGDSRVYLLRDGELSQVTTDHTFVQSLVDEGKITPEEARVHPHRSLLLRAMLGRDDNAADFDWFEAQEGDRILLCSDGLSDMADRDDIEAALGSETIDMAATELIRLALEGGGYDNITVVIGELVDADTVPDERLSCVDGQPQLVGAASENPRPPTTQQTGGGPAPAPKQVHAQEIDPEELRYAHRDAPRRRWLRPLAALVVILGILAGLGYGGYKYTQTQYYVGVSDSHVVIYRGVDLDLPFTKLSHVEETTDILVSSLPDSYARQVRDGITDIGSLNEARETVAELRAAAERTSAKPKPKPSPSSSKTPESQDT